MFLMFFVAIICAFSGYRSLKFYRKKKRQAALNIDLSGFAFPHDPARKTHTGLNDFEALVINNSALQVALLESLPLARGKDMVNALVYLNHAADVMAAKEAEMSFPVDTSKNLALLKRLSVRQVQEEQSKDAEELFRVNSYATKVYYAFLRTRCLPWMYTTIRDPIETLLEQSKKDNIQLKQKSGAQQGGADENTLAKYVILAATQKIFQVITSSINEIPLEVRASLNSLRQIVTLFFPNSEMADTAVAGMFFLRFVCPALVMPHTYGLITEKPEREGQASLKIVSKVMQNLANDAKQQKEEYMQQLAEFVEVNRVRMKDYFKKLGQVPSSDEAPPGVRMPLKAKHWALAVVYDHLSDRQDSVLQHELLKGNKGMIQQIQAAMDSKNAVLPPLHTCEKTGWLYYVDGNKVVKWFFVVNDNLLWGLTSDADSKVKMTWLLDECEISIYDSAADSTDVSLGPKAIKALSGKFGFRVDVAGKKPAFFYADLYFARQAWINSLKAAASVEEGKKKGLEVETMRQSNSQGGKGKVQGGEDGQEEGPVLGATDGQDEEDFLPATVCVLL